MSTAEIVKEAPAGVFHEALSLDSIEPSKTNPRKHFDKADLEDLAKSIKEKGVIQPIVVRPHPKGSSKLLWEIIAGERRYRASKIAGAGTIPAIARNLDDRAVLEIQVIENLQRVDIHPLDEALGYKELLEKHGYDVDTLAAKVGKSSSYIYQRLKLAELIPAAQKFFTAGVINPGHAILIARQSPEDQNTIVNEKGGLLWGHYFQKDAPEAISVRRLTQEIRRNLYLDLAKAPWKQNDTKLLPAAGACAVCPKRTGANPGLFPDIDEKNICTDRGCYNQKLDAFMKRAVHEGGLIQISTEYGAKPKTAGAIARGQYTEIYEKGDRCKFTQKAIVVEGYDRGSSHEICIDKDCKKHQLNRSSSGSSYNYKAEEARRQKKKRAETERRGRIFAAVLEKAPAKLGREDLELVAKSSWKRLHSDAQKLVMKAHGGIEPQKKQFGLELDKPAFAFIDKANDAQLVRFMIATALGPDLSVNSYGPSDKAEHLLALAKRLKVDVNKIDAAIKAEQKAKPKKKVQTSAKSKAAAETEPEDDAEGDYDDPMEDEE